MTIQTPLPYRPAVIHWPEKGKSSITYIVPVGQEWLYAMLEKQDKHLANISTGVTFISIIILLGIVVSACSAIGLL
jgi:hypothetical protein